jgi:hypothetical protein
MTPRFRLDLKKHNAQYPPVDVRIFARSHDRFLFIDGDVYHIGASLKDMGRLLSAHRTGPAGDERNSEGIGAESGRERQAGRV